MKTEHNSNSNSRKIYYFIQTKWMCSRQQMKFQTGRWIYMCCVYFFFTECVAVETKLAYSETKYGVLIKDRVMVALLYAVYIWDCSGAEWDSSTQRIAVTEQKKCHNVAWMEFRGQNSLVDIILRIRIAVIVALTHTHAHLHTSSHGWHFVFVPIQFVVCTSHYW